MKIYIFTESLTQPLGPHWTDPRSIFSMILENGLNASNWGIKTKQMGFRGLSCHLVCDTS